MLTFKGASLSKKARLSIARMAIMIVLVIGILLSLLVSYVVLSTSSLAAQNQATISVTTVTLVIQPLNYSAYQIMIPSTAIFSLRYTFFPVTHTGSLNMSASWGNFTSSNNSESYTACNQTFDCGLYITPSAPEITYSSGSVATIDYMVVVDNSTKAGEYLFFPAGSGCFGYITLIIGNNVPSKLPTLGFDGCIIRNPSSVSNFSVIATQNARGLNTPYSNQ